LYCHHNAGTSRYFRKVLRKTLPQTREEINTRLAVRAWQEFSCFSLFIKYQCNYEIGRLLTVYVATHKVYKKSLQSSPKPMAKYGRRYQGVAGEEFGGGGGFSDPGGGGSKSIEKAGGSRKPRLQFK